VDRRDFLNTTLAAGALGASMAAERNPQSPATNITIEREASGTPHKGKVFALVTPHLDDGPIFAGGTIAKLLNEGYTGYLVRTSNDEKDSYRLSLGETVLANERDAHDFVKVTNMKQVFDPGYRNHRMDEASRTELRARLIFLFRLLKVNTILSYDPWGHYEENPDHYVTAQCVEAACWMAGGRLDLPEHFAAGLKPQSVTEKYYFARGPQLVNRVVDIAPFLETKLQAIRCCRTMLDHMVQDFNASLAARNQRVPALTGDKDSAIGEYAKAVFQERDRTVGQKYGLEYAEEFHYIGPDTSLDAYVSRHAVPL
jgi:LmbE family N-acetylglucosaminyl deacetylase